MILERFLELRVVSGAWSSFESLEVSIVWRGFVSVASSWHSKIVPFHQRLIIRDIPTKTARLRWCTLYCLHFFMIATLSVII